MMDIAIVGARGVVGRELITLFEKKSFPVNKLFLFASSTGHLPFRGKEIPVQTFQKNSIPTCDLVFFCCPSSISRDLVPYFSKARIIDLSSAHRMERAVPLIVPEVNANVLQQRSRIISSPNCVATLLSLAIAPIHQVFPIKKLIVTTYQAASGAGNKAINALLDETKTFLSDKEHRPSYFHVPYAFNLFLHDNPDEETKIIQETRKILQAPALSISPTCVRVPTLRAHCLSIHLECKGAIDRKQAWELLNESKGIELCSEKELHPVQASGKENVLCGRVRQDPSMPNTLELWVVGDQLLKGAALNAYQIAELIQ